MDAVGIFRGPTTAAFAGYLTDRYGPSFPVRMLENAGQMVSPAFGLPLSNYAGVLIGATAIPVGNLCLGTGCTCIQQELGAAVTG